MGADMTISTIATAAGDDRIDWAGAEKALDRVASIADFGWDENDLEVLDVDPEDLAGLIEYGHRVLDGLKAALDSRYTTVIEVGDYWVHLSGGLSWGDPPTDEYNAIAAAYGLPDAVLRTAGFIPDHSGPLSRRAGNRGPVTDTDVVDAIALGLGTRSEWSGDELQWIPELIATVRPRPGGEGSPGDYLAHWKQTYGEHSLEDAFLQQRISDEAQAPCREPDEV